MADPREAVDLARKADRESPKAGELEAVAGHHLDCPDCGARPDVPCPQTVRQHCDWKPVGWMHSTPEGETFGSVHERNICVTWGHPRCVPVYVAVPLTRENINGR